jgi:hypothetical protein
MLGDSPSAVRPMPYIERAESMDPDIVAGDERIADRSEALVHQAAGFFLSNRTFVSGDLTPRSKWRSGAR